MSGLKLLILPKGNFSGSLDFLSNELGYLDWKEYPFTYLPSNFQPNKLVKLILTYSNIKELWEGIKDLHNLTHMELCHSKNLVKIPNLSQALNLEHLDLEGCVKLVHLDASTGSLEKLHFLNLKNCRSLVSIPNSIFCLNSLYDINLSGCKRLFKYQLLEKSRPSKQLNAGQSVERHMTSSIRKTLTRPLQFLSSRRRANSVGLLVPSVSRFPALVSLDISFSNLIQIPAFSECYPSKQESDVSFQIEAHRGEVVEKLFLVLPLLDRFLFEPFVEIFPTTMMFTANSSVQSPKHKFLAIEDHQ
nr:disease resistance protein RPP2A-like [Arachis hypogaea]